MLVRWESDTRCYIVHVSPDLWGTLTLRRVWGGIGSARGSEMMEVIEGDDVPEQISARLEAIDKQRRRRGYLRPAKKRPARCKSTAVHVSKIFTVRAVGSSGYSHAPMISGHPASGTLLARP